MYLLIKQQQQEAQGFPCIGRCGARPNESELLGLMGFAAPQEWLT